MDEQDRAFGATVPRLPERRACGFCEQTIIWQPGQLGSCGSVMPGGDAPGRGSLLNARTRRHEKTSNPTTGFLDRVAAFICDDIISQGKEKRSRDQREKQYRVLYETQCLMASFPSFKIDAAISHLPKQACDFVNILGKFLRNCCHETSSASGMRDAKIQV
jgi:hypothetical protein